VTAVTFGDLLFTGIGQLGAAAGLPQDSGGPAAAAGQLRRITSALVRHLDAVGPWHDALALGRADLIWWQRAGADMSQALLRAGRALGAAGQALGGGADGPGEPPPGWPLAAAATTLAAARDLLSTHLDAGPAGSVSGRTEWAAVITSAPVIRAVTDLVASWCQQLAPLADDLAGQVAGAPGAARELAAAGQWLRQAAAFARPAQAADPVTAADRTLLFAIPLAGASRRDRPRPGESTAALCQGITASAGRLQAVTRGAAQRAAWSPEATAGAWRWTATAGAVASHLSSAMLAGLAGLAGPLGLPGEDLYAAADALAAAQASWQQLAAAWGLITTETRFLVSRPMTEASDLLVRLGRLACDNPAWTPQAADQAPLRDPAGLAPDSGTAAAVLAAVHHAACALERVAAADLDAVQAARRARRLYVPVRVIGKILQVRTDLRTIPRAYVVAQPGQTEELLAAYQAAAAASSAAAQALDAAAAAAGAPSRGMALARATLRREESLDPGPPGVPGPAPPNPWAGGPGPVEHKLIRLRVTDEVLLRRAALVDAAAEKLLADALSAAADPWAGGPGPVEGKLIQLGVTDQLLLRRAALVDAAGESLLAEALDTAGGPGPVERKLTQLGVADELLLRRAALVDAAGESLLAMALCAVLDAAAGGPAVPGPAARPAGRRPGPPAAAPRPGPGPSV